MRQSCASTQQLAQQQSLLKSILLIPIALLILTPIALTLHLSKPSHQDFQRFHAIQEIVGANRLILLDPETGDTIVARICGIQNRRSDGAAQLLALLPQEPDIRLVRLERGEVVVNLYDAEERSIAQQLVSSGHAEWIDEKCAGLSQRTILSLRSEHI